MQDFRNLVVWQKSHKLTLEVYAESAHLPRESAASSPASARGDIRARQHCRRVWPGR